MVYDVAVTRMPVQAVFDLKGSKAALEDWAGAGLPGFAEEANRWCGRGGVRLCHVGPGRWLVLAALAEEAALEAALRPAEAPPEISVVRISDTLAFFRIEGPEAGEIMAIGCPMDLHGSVFGEDAVSWTEFFGLKALVLRCEGGFELAVEQSFGAMMGDYLTRAVG